MPKGHYNPSRLLRFVKLAASRRIDIVGVWNSEGLQAGSGWDTAITAALGVDRYGVYATPAYPWLEGTTGSGIGTGYNYASGAASYEYAANGTLFTYANPLIGTAGANQLQWLNWSAAPTAAGTKPLHVPLGDTKTDATGFAIYNIAGTSRNNPIPIAEALTFTFWGVNYTSGGSIKPIIRCNGTPNFAEVYNFGVITHTGTDGVVRKTSTNIAANAARSSWNGLGFRSHEGFNPATLIGPMFLTWMRACRTNKSTGIAVTPFYSVGSMSAYDIYEAINSVPQETFEHFFDVLCEYQTGGLSQHMAIIDVYEGSNQGTETLISAGAPNQVTADAVENYVWYMRAIVAKFRTGWTASGRDAANLCFRVSCSHPLNDTLPEAKMVTYRAALKAGMDFAGTDADVCVLDRAEISSLTEHLSKGDFADTVHLNHAGYLRTERKTWNTLLGGSWRSSRARGRVSGGSR